MCCLVSEDPADIVFVMDDSWSVSVSDTFIISLPQNIFTCSRVENVTEVYYIHVNVVV